MEWNSVVYTQTCGHYLHFDCYNSYKEAQTVKKQNKKFSSSFKFSFRFNLSRM